MNKTLFLACTLSASSLMAAAQTKNAGPQILDPEPLDRGVIVVPAKVTTGAGDGTSKGRLVNWRCLATDGDSVTFTIIKNGEVITTSKDSRMTSYHDPTGLSTDTYRITVRRGGVVTERPTTHYLKNGYLELPLDRPTGGTTTTGAYTYRPNDCSVGDVDGDGEYEIILKWDPSNSQDNSLSGVTGNVLLDCYKLDGTKLWRIDLGQNIRAGAHYTQFMVYDLDGDGKAEVACKTAPGTIDGLGNYVLMGDDDPTADYRKTYKSIQGIIKTGPEYLTVFDGQTGANRCTVSYVPLRSVRTDSEWGDTYGNRCERYLACIAYLDGKHPSLVMCRGYYTASYLCAWDFDGTNLTQRWLHKSETKGVGAYGEGAHSLSVGDVDGDGCDEIVYGSACIDHDGTVLYRTGFGHGDALHLGDFDPDREGLEVFMVHEEKTSAYKYDTEFRDAKTGEVIWGLLQSGNDIGRGLAADIDSTRRGVECWPIKDYTNSTSGESAVFTCTGENFSSNRPTVNFGIYYKNYRYQQCFDASESSNTALIQEWNQKNKKMSTLVDFAKNYKVRGCNSTKGTPCLQADILGDWREEVVLYDSTTFDRLLIFSSPYVTTDVIPTFMHDHQYRMAVAWQNVAYNQPPHLSYYLPDFDYDTYIEKLKSSSTSAIERVSSSDRLGSVRCITLPGKLQLLCSGLEGQSLRLRLLDMGGRTLREEVVTVGSDASVMVETESLAGRHGVFLVSLTGEPGQWSTKVVL
jgi:hypothetical protein